MDSLMIIALPLMLGLSVILLFVGLSMPSKPSVDKSACKRTARAPAL